MTSIQIDRTDGLSSSVAIKGPCRAATTANVTLSGEQTIDGVAVVTDDRVLVKDQTTASENGIYVADTGPWRRAKDFSRTSDVITGTHVYVTSGSVAGGGSFIVATTGAITIGTTSISFSTSPSLSSLGGSAAGIDGFKYDFDTVTLLIADTVRTYSNTTAGDYIRTRAEGMSFLVAASGASDHITVTAGGLKLYFTGDVEPIAPENALRIGESISVDAGPAIRRILAAGNPLLLNAGQTYIVSYDPASTLGGGAYGYSILVPDNAVIIANGGIIKQADDAPDWCRTVSFRDASAFHVFGTLRVDANVENVTGGNEHMHGVFLYDSSDFYIEAIDSWSARGDNVYLGGTSNTRGTCDGYVGRIVGTKAGRKNFVGQCFDNLHIGSAILDNSTGGAAIFGGVADTTDGNCFDIEPDSFDGTVPNRMVIDYLYTKGAGNDLSAGTTAVIADAMVISIGKWNCEIVSRSTVPWYLQYAVTVNIDEWNVWGITSTSAVATLYNAVRLNVGTAKINGVLASATTSFLEMSPSSGDQPRVSFDNLTITGTGQGIENKDGILDIGKYVARTSGYAFRTRGLGSAAVYAETNIDFLDLLDVGVPAGAAYAVLVGQSGTAVHKTRIGHLKHRDTRGSKNARVIYITAGGSPGLVIGSIDDDGTGVAIIGGDGPDKFYRSAGGGKGPSDFMCIGTPEAQITAPIGSIARQIDGGIASAAYVKATGTGNTGWVAIAPAKLISALTADFTGTDVSTAQPVFSASQDTLTVDALTSYRFRAEYVITRAAGTTSHTTGVLFGGTATFTSIDGIARASNPTGNVLGAPNDIQITAATETVVTAANTSATENVRITLDGVMRINGAGTIIPQFKFSAAPGGAPTVKRNSFFECWPIGSNTVAAVGGWA